MIEIVVLILGIVGIILFNENRGRLKKVETDLLVLKKSVADLTYGKVVAAPVADTIPDVIENPAEPVITEPAMAEKAVAQAAMSETIAEDNDNTVAEPALMDLHESVSAQIPASPVKPAQSLESRLGAQWTVWVGGVALALGGLFFVKYSIEAGLLSPMVRIVLAALFGFALIAAGEFVRRRTPEAELANFQTAMIPGVLTAAGSLTLFGTIYAAHNFYEFIGPATAFVLLALVSLGTIALSLRHGQAMAGLGLLASLATPAMVISTEPRPWSLFGYLTIVWLATLLASRIRQWSIVPILAALGVGGWAFLYMGDIPDFEVLPIVLPMLTILFGIAFVWPATLPLLDEPSLDGKAIFAHRSTGLIAAGSVIVALVGGVIGAQASYLSGPALWSFFGLTLLLAAYGAWRTNAIFAAIFASLAIVGGFAGLVETVTSSAIVTAVDATQALINPYTIIRMGLIMGLAVLGLMAWVLWRHAGKQKVLTLSWTFPGVIVPLALAAISFANFGNFERDWTYGLYLVLLAILFGGLADWMSRNETDANPLQLHSNDVLVGGHFAAAVGSIFVLTNGLATTILLPLLGLAYLLLAQRRPIRVLPWLMVVSAILVAGRIAMDPTIVGPEHLSKTPIFNQLLPAYGIPALVLAFGAWLYRNSERVQLRAALEALASLFVLLTLAIEVRHLMNGGTLEGALPTLSEQSIYTLLAIGASATMMALDFRRSSQVFRIGSMLIAGISIAMVAIVHFITLNPFFSGELTGSIPFLNLLLLGYLLPGIAYAGLAWFARNRRPLWFVRIIALVAALMGFVYVTLSVRRIWQGQSIADWQGFLQGETYTYSVVWLLLGVGLLAVGYRFKAQSIRIASAVLVFVAVFKVFLIDMSNLEGLYRAVSFVGLGLVLIGIGRFYQHILMGDRKPIVAEEQAEGAAQT